MNIVLFVLLFFTVIMTIIYYLFNKNNKKQSEKNISDLKTELEKVKSELNENKVLIKQLHEQNQFDMFAGKIISQMNQGVICINQERTIQLVNPYAEQFTKFQPCIGKPYQQAIHILINGIQDCSKFEEAFTGMNQILPSNTEIATQRGKIPITGSIIPLKFDNLNTSIAFTFHDDSQNMVRIQEEKSFFSTAAHELRTPLTGIQMSILTLLQRFDTLGREKIIEYLTQTNTSVEYLIKLVNDFLNVSRIDQGRMEVENKPFNMMLLTDEVIQDLSLLMKERKLFIHHKPVEDRYRNVIGDPIKAKEVLTNLIGNSIKYTIQGGITISHQSTHTSFITKISDTGNGIPLESQPLLFKRFFQIGGARLQSSSKGSGLGLYISKKIAQLMHGDVKLESSEPGKGSTFIFTMPFVSE